MPQSCTPRLRTSLQTPQPISFSLLLSDCTRWIRVRFHNGQRKQGFSAHRLCCERNGARSPSASEPTNKVFLGPLRGRQWPFFHHKVNQLRHPAKIGDRRSGQNSLSRYGGKKRCLDVSTRPRSRYAPSDSLNMTRGEGVSFRGPEGPLFHRNINAVGTPPQNSTVESASTLESQNRAFPWAGLCQQKFVLCESEQLRRVGLSRWPSCILFPGEIR